MLGCRNSGCSAPTPDNRRRHALASLHAATACRRRWPAFTATTRPPGRHEIPGLRREPRFLPRPPVDGASTAPRAPPHTQLRPHRYREDCLVHDGRRLLRRRSGRWFAWSAGPRPPYRARPSGNLRGQRPRPARLRQRDRLLSPRRCGLQSDMGRRRKARADQHAGCPGPLRLAAGR